MLAARCVISATYRSSSSPLRNMYEGKRGTRRVSLLPRQRRAICAVGRKKRTPLCDKSRARAFSLRDFVCTTQSGAIRSCGAQERKSSSSRLATRLEPDNDRVCVSIVLLSLQTQAASARAHSARSKTNCFPEDFCVGTRGYARKSLDSAAEGALP